MQHQSRFSVFKVAGLMSVLCPALALGAPQVPPSAPVTVVNTSANPVPVTGSTTVSGSVAATQSGSWTVNANIQGTPSVAVANTAAAPALISSVDDPGRIPYQASHTMNVNNDCNFPSNDECSFIAPAVPAGKRLVIQHVSVDALTDGGTFVRARVQDENSFAILSAFLVPLSPTPPNVAAGDKAVQVYLDGGAQFGYVVHVATDHTFGPAAQVFVNVTGYLLDCAVNKCAAIAP